MGLGLGLGVRARVGVRVSALGHLVQLGVLHARTLLELAHLALGCGEVVAQPDDQLRQHRVADLPREELVGLLAQHLAGARRTLGVEVDGDVAIRRVAEAQLALGIGEGVRVGWR